MTSDDHTTWSRRRFLRTTGTLSLGAVLSMGTAVASDDDGDIDYEVGLRGIARHHYRFFEEFTTDIGFPDDVVDVSGKSVKQSHRTSPSNIAMYIVSTVGADELDIISAKEARERVRTLLDTLERVETWNGLFLRWYDIRDGSSWAASHGNSKLISTVDNGHLTAALVVIGQAYDGTLGERAMSLVRAQNYSPFHDPENGKLIGSYDFESGFADWEYGTINSEPRVASYCAIGKGDFPKTHWWQPNRTYLPDATWTQQTAEGEWKTYDGVDVFEGHYEYNGTKYVPSWGGAQFEALMPSLFIKEKELGTDGFGLNNQHWVNVQIEFAKDQGWSVWGLSPCGTPNGYGAFGVPDQGAWDGHYQGGPIVTPHAGFLAADYAPHALSENIKELRNMGIEGEYGFYDSVNAETGEVTEKFYALDQGMSIGAIANYLTDGAIREHFHQSKIGQRPEDLLTREEFTI